MTDNVSMPTQLDHQKEQSPKTARGCKRNVAYELCTNDILQYNSSLGCSNYECAVLRITNCLLY